MVLYVDGVGEKKGMYTKKDTKIHKFMTKANKK